MKEIDNKIKHLQELLKLEKQTDLDMYLSTMEGTSFPEQRKRGVCWYPVAVEKTKFDSGDRLLMHLSRPKEHIEQHQFQSGKLVRFFANTNNADDDLSVTGVVNYAKEHDMMITLNCDEIPFWLNEGKLGIQLLFDENSYKEMEYALQKLLSTTEDFHINHKHILLGDKAPEFSEQETATLPFLNETQNKAFNKVMSAKDVAIVHGPPGTGKTTTLVQTILHTLKHEEQVMVTAPSNAAVDILVEKLSGQGVKVVRIGHPARVTEEILRTTLDSQIAHHTYYKELKAVRRQAEEFHRMARKYKRSFGKEEREQRKAMYTEAKKLQQEAGQLSFYISSDILSKAEVIACTLVGAANPVIRDRRYGTVFIDEAAQALEPATWIPILKSRRVVFAGDHCQLPPTIKSYEAAKAGLAETLFEKTIQSTNAASMLCEQYRMNSQIMEFSNRAFYNSELIANSSVAQWKLFGDDTAIEFIDTAGTGYFEQQDPESKSTYNKEEAELLKRHYDQLFESLCINKIEEATFGVIAPYKAQVGLLQDLFAEELTHNAHLSVNTIDSFQGQERDVIYISLTRSNETGEIGFLSDTRRMNVAITRAKKKLVVIGDSATIGNHPFYDSFINYVTEIDAYRSAFEFMYE